MDAVRIVSTSTGSSSLPTTKETTQPVQWCSFEAKTFSNDDCECMAYLIIDTNIDTKNKPKTGALTKSTNDYVCSGPEQGSFYGCKIYDFGSSASSTWGIFDNSATTESAKTTGKHDYKIVGNGIAYDPFFVKQKNEKDEAKIINIKEVYNSVFT